MNFSSLFRRQERSRQARIDELESKIIRLEGVRDEQSDINAKMKVSAEEERRELRRASEDRAAQLNRQIGDMELRMKRADEDMAHLVRIKESKLKIEFDEKCIAMEKAKNAEIEVIRNEYRDKIESHLNGRIGELGKMYENVLARLPDINVALKGRVGE
jgi:hypothetical protein